MHYFSTTAGLALLAALITGCGGGGGGSGGEVADEPMAGETGEVRISGRVTFDLVPHNTFNNSLDYANTESRPVRLVAVEALNASGSVLRTALTDANGEYSLTVPENTDVRIRVKAQLVESGQPAWNFRVTDNTNGNALYVMDGQLLSSGEGDSRRDLHAPSGWSGGGYGDARVAAPFAILDAVHDALQLVLQVSPLEVFPAAELRWSVNNRAVENDTDTENGELPTSFYSASEGNIYLLGAEDLDTDEYDRHLIIHEWGHYFEDRFSRADSLGGSHSLNERLDMRLAFSEGWGNALSGMATGDPIYRDALGVNQGSGFSFSLEQNQFANQGWHSEASVQTILYDIFDSVDDGADLVTAGFDPIYQVLTDAEYRQQSSFTSIFSFLTRLLALQPSLTDDVNALSGAEQIDGSGLYGEGESGGPAIALPVYQSVTVGGPNVTVCSDQAAINDGEYNKLENRRFLRVTIASAGSYTFRAERVSGLASSDPDMFIYRAGEFRGIADSAVNNSEQINLSLEAGDYVFEVFEADNVDEESTTGGNVCFSVRVF